MSRSTQLRMVPLKVPQIALRAFQDELTAVKLDFLLWGWNWVTKKDEIFFGALFKNSKHSKNGYKTRDYKDRGSTPPAFATAPDCNLWTDSHSGLPLMALR
ncbi:hypothetical protein AXG93_105s1000 [Marchantia polymorpha subsp. ruderalis]|uniref:Uncharacterized protein n=1 Tax=Marchantia polymorpha subsp. ruderalis TaxID=1480154 RepID=A0A176VJH4_MARPO|nr:hypothetical protein AXG93_105s1000 [Marchantia polymorpha subsp. ruderalis]